MSCQCNERVAQIKTQIKEKYNLDDEAVDIAYNMALSDYLLIKYPSDNNRPSAEQLTYDFVTTQWLYKRMMDILERAGLNLKGYSENGLSFTYADGNIDPVLVAQIMPRAGVPR